MFLCKSTRLLQLLLLIASRNAKNGKIHTVPGKLTIISTVHCTAFMSTELHNNLPNYSAVHISMNGPRFPETRGRNWIIWECCHTS